MIDIVTYSVSFYRIKQQEGYLSSAVTDKFSEKACAKLETLSSSLVSALLYVKIYCKEILG